MDDQPVIEVPVKDNLFIKVDGIEVKVTFHTFPAFTGFELNRRYRIDYKLQSDRNARAAYAISVLAYAEVGGKRLEHIAAIDEALGTWQNVEEVFHGVLAYNGIDLELAEEKARWFEFAGAELAATFVAEASLLMKPFLETAAERGN